MLLKSTYICFDLLRNVLSNEYEYAGLSTPLVTQVQGGLYVLESSARSTPLSKLAQKSLATALTRTERAIVQQGN